jgi:acyl dehydratase
MTTPTLYTLAELREKAGQHIGTSDWHLITQQQNIAFGDAIEEYHPVHSDPEYARRAGLPGPVANGMYVLSLGTKLLWQIIELKDVRLGLFYGFNRVRFLSPIPVDSRVRMSLELASAITMDATASQSGGSRFTFKQTFEVEGQERPGCVAETLLSWYE